MIANTACAVDCLKLSKSVDVEISKKVKRREDKNPIKSLSAQNGKDKQEAFPFVRNSN